MGYVHTERQKVIPSPLTRQAESETHTQVHTYARTQGLTKKDRQREGHTGKQTQETGRQTDPITDKRVTVG